MKQISVSKNEAGQRLDKLLAKYLNLASKNFLYKMLRKKNITLNGKKANGNEMLVQGDQIKIFLSDETFDKFSNIQVQAADSSDLMIIYEDSDVLILNKPAGMLSQKAKPSDVSMVEKIIQYTLETGKLSKEELRSFQPAVCNRLDRNTSGLLIAGIVLFLITKVINSHIYKDDETKSRKNLRIALFTAAISLYILFCIIWVILVNPYVVGDSVHVCNLAQTFYRENLQV